MSRSRERLTAACALAGLLALGACAGVQEHEQEAAVPPEEMQAYLADQPARARPLYAAVLRQGQRNAVLNHMRAGLAAFELGADEAAARSFDLALQGIEAVYADNEEAAKARSKFTKESVKDFKGEPYERAMAYYYRGLLYLRAGDYENARASFRGRPDPGQPGAGREVRPGLRAARAARRLGLALQRRRGARGRELRRGQGLPRRPDLAGRGRQPSADRRIGQGADPPGEGDQGRGPEPPRALRGDHAEPPRQRGDRRRRRAAPALYPVFERRGGHPGEAPSR